LQGGTASARPPPPLFRGGETIGIAAALENAVFLADALAIGGDVELTVYRPAIRPLAGAPEPHPVFRRCG